ncbi:MAG: peptide deformylase [Treponema sp.]
MNILFLGEETLQQPSLPVQTIDTSLHELIRDMFVIMEKDRGIGLAAPQIGKNIRLFIVKIDDGIERVFINPHIIATSERQCSYEEGCLSIPKVYASVTRPEAVTVQYQDLNGKRKTMEASGLLARVIQHEYDHLDGILFVDRLPETEKSELVDKFQRNQQKQAQRRAKRRMSAPC